MKRRAPPCTSAATGSDRASTSKDFINDDELLKALHFSVAKSADDLSKTEELKGMTFDQNLLSNVASLVWDTVVSDWTTDLLSFSSHAKRSTVDKDDVLLLMRRNESLTRTICSEADIDLDAPSKKTKTPVVRKRKSDTSSDNTPKLTRRGKKASDISLITEGDIVNCDVDPFEPPDRVLSPEMIKDDVHHPIIARKDQADVPDEGLSVRGMPDFSSVHSPIRTEVGADNPSAIQRMPEVDADEQLSVDSFNDAVEFMRVPVTSTPKAKSVVMSMKRVEEQATIVDRFSDEEDDHNVTRSPVKLAPVNTTGGAFSAFTFESQSSDDALGSDARESKNKQEEKAYDSFDEYLDSFLSISKADVREVKKNVNQPSDEKDSFDDLFNCD